MADITNPGIRKELKDAESDLDDYGKTATILMRHHHASATALIGVGWSAP
jgi:hypothetical protein